MREIEATNGVVRFQRFVHFDKVLITLYLMPQMHINIATKVNN